MSQSVYWYAQRKLKLSGKLRGPVELQIKGIRLIKKPVVK